MTGQVEITFVDAICRTLARAMREDERVIVLGEDVAEGEVVDVAAPGGTRSYEIVAVRLA